MSTAKEPSRGLQVSRAHHIVAVLELSAGLQAALLELLLLLHHVDLIDVALGSHHPAHRSGSDYCGVLPSNLELGHSWLLHQDVTSEACDVGLLGGVLRQLWLLVVVVDVVADAEELLLSVGTGNQNASHTHDLRLHDSADVRWLTLLRVSMQRAYLENKLHLARLNLVHLSLLEYLILLRIRSLTDVYYPPCECYTRK